MTPRERIAQLLVSCAEPGWDSYGADPINRDCAEAAVKWLESAFIAPLSNGGVRVEWDQRDVKLSIAVDFLPDGREFWVGGEWKNDA